MKTAKLTETLFHSMGMFFLLSVLLSGCGVKKGLNEDAELEKLMMDALAAEQQAGAQSDDPLGETLDAAVPKGITEVIIHPWDSAPSQGRSVFTSFFSNSGVTATGISFIVNQGTFVTPAGLSGSAGSVSISNPNTGVGTVAAGVTVAGVGSFGGLVRCIPGVACVFGAAGPNGAGYSVCTASGCSGASTFD